jgi:hypothetical protein
MARPKIVRTKEEAAQVDPGLPIQVEVSSDPSVVVQGQPAAPNGQGGGASISQAAPPPPPAQLPREEPELSSLKAQLEQMRKNHEEQARQIADFQRRETELRRQYDNRHQEAQTSMHRAHQAEVDAVNNAAAAAQGELDSAKTAMAIAGQTQDWQAMAEAQERIAEAKTRLIQLTDAKAGLADRAERAKQAQTQYYQQPYSIDQQIDAMNISYPQKQWFKRHPDVLQDDYKRTKVGMAHYEAINHGLTQDSPDYFDAVDVYMGYKQPPKVEEEDDDVPAPLPQSVSAPVSREAPSAATGRPTTTRITLTAAQREAARDAGVDEITYARGLLELERRKQIGLYQNG